MARVFLSFLGTSNYAECNYYYGNKTNRVDKVKYIQEASIRLFCKSWIKHDKVVIFLTRDARERNWRDFTFDRQGGSPQEGLENRFRRFNFPMQVIPVDIPHGLDTKDIWHVFSVVLSQLSEKDEVIFDITHAFRFMPMLALSLLNYAKVMKNIKVLRICYGAYEARDNRTNDAPIFDLTSFIELQEWTNAAGALIEYGNPDKIIEMLDYPQYKQHNTLRTIISRIYTNFTSVRGISLVMEDYKKLISEIEKLKERLFPPFKQVVDIIKIKFLVFKQPEKEINFKDVIINGFHAVDWCVDHKLYQQGFTLLQEVLITAVMLHAGVDYTNHKYRTIVSATFTIHRNQTPEDQWFSYPAEEREITKRLLENNPFLDTLKDEYIELGDLRNDMNHGGFRHNAMAANKFGLRLNELTTRIKKAVVSYFNLD